MKKLTNLSLCMAIPLFSAIFASFGCSKDKEKNIMMSIDTIPVIPADTVPVITPDTVPDHTTAISYLALGDSYTIGQSVAATDRFPAQTEAQLKIQYLNVNSPRYIATTGWTTTNLINAISYENPPKTYDIVTLLIGVNDQYQHMDTGSYRVKFTQLLNTSIQLAASRKERVFVLSIPDYSVTPFVVASYKAQVSHEIDAFNSINKEITLSYGITYVDITPSTRLGANDSTLIAGDGLHPSGKEYKVWADMLAPLIQKVLK